MMSSGVRPEETEGDRFLRKRIVEYYLLTGELGKTESTASR